MCKNINENEEWAQDERDLATLPDIVAPPQVKEGLSQLVIVTMEEVA